MADDAAPQDGILSGEEVYDIIMASIEPELVTKNLPLLEQQHAGETPEAKAERMKRYEAAFAKYDEEFAKFMEKLHKEVHAVKRDARASAEMKEKEAEAKLEEDLLAKMQAI